MADKNKKKLTDKEEAEKAAAAAFEEIDAAVEKEAVEEAADAPAVADKAPEAADAPAVADKAPEAAAEAASEPIETARTVVDPMAGSALGEGLSLPEGSETEAAASEESAEDPVPEEDEAPADDRPEESPEAEAASEDEVETLEEDSEFTRVGASATGMPEGELSGEVAPGAAESTSTEAVEKEEEKPVLETVPAEEEPVLETVPAESDGRYYEADAYLESSELAKFNAAYLSVESLSQEVSTCMALLADTFYEAKNAKANKLRIKQRKSTYALLDTQKQNLEKSVKNLGTVTATLKSYDSLWMNRYGVSQQGQEDVARLIVNAENIENGARAQLSDVRKWQKKRTLKNTFIGLGIGLGAALVVGSAGEIPDAYGHGWWFLGGEVPPPPNDNQIIIDVDDMDVARIQSVLNGVIGNTSVKVEAIKSIQVDADNNYHLILDADKKGTDCLIDINMGEQSGFENTTALVETLMGAELNKDDINTYYALNSFINDEAATANISVAIENQLGSTGTASGGVYAKASYATDRVNGVYNADIDFLVFDEAGNASIMDDAITASSKSDFRNNLWDVVYQAYGGPSTNFDGEIMQHPTITNLTPAQMTIVNVTTGAAVSTGISLER